MPKPFPRSSSKRGALAPLGDTQTRHHTTCLSARAVFCSGSGSFIFNASRPPLQMDLAAGLVGIHDARCLSHHTYAADESPTLTPTRRNRWVFPQSAGRGCMGMVDSMSYNVSVAAHDGTHIESRECCMWLTWRNHTWRNHVRRTVLGLW